MALAAASAWQGHEAEMPDVPASLANPRQAHAPAAPPRVYVGATQEVEVEAQQELWSNQRAQPATLPPPFEVLLPPTSCVCPVEL